MYCILCHRTGGPQGVQDISRPSSPIGAIGCIACVLCHRTGGPQGVQDITRRSSPIGAIGCTAFVLCHRTGGPQGLQDISSWGSIGAVFGARFVELIRCSRPWLVWAAWGALG